MSILRFLECNRCKKKAPYEENKDAWLLVYTVPPRFSPSYAEDTPALCPKCCEHLDRFLEGFAVSTIKINKREK